MRNLRTAGTRSDTLATTAERIDLLQTRGAGDSRQARGGAARNRHTAGRRTSAGRRRSRRRQNNAPHALLAPSIARSKGSNYVGFAAVNVIGLSIYNQQFTLRVEAGPLFANVVLG